MTASGTLHDITVETLATLPTPVELAGLVILETDFDPRDVSAWLRSEGHDDAADVIDDAADIHDRIVWGTL